MVYPSRKLELPPDSLLPQRVNRPVPWGVFVPFLWVRYGETDGSPPSVSAAEDFRDARTVRTLPGVEALPQSGCGMRGRDNLKGHGEFLAERIKGVKRMVGELNSLY